MQDSRYFGEYAIVACLGSCAPFIPRQFWTLPALRVYLWCTRNFLTIGEKVRSFSYTGDDQRSALYTKNWQRLRNECRNQQFTLILLRGVTNKQLVPAMWQILRGYSPRKHTFANGLDYILSIPLTRAKKLYMSTLSLSHHEEKRAANKCFDFLCRSQRRTQMMNTQIRIDQARLRRGKAKSLGHCIIPSIQRGEFPFSWATRNPAGEDIRPECQRLP